MFNLARNSMLMYRRLTYDINTSEQISARGEQSVSRINRTNGTKQWVIAVFNWYMYLVPVMIPGVRYTSSCCLLPPHSSKHMHPGSKKHLGKIYEYVCI